MANVLDGSNKANYERAGSWVTEIERLNAEKETIMAEARNKCKRVQDQITEQLDDAKDQGHSKGTIKDVVKRRKLEAKIKKLDDGFDDDQKVDVIGIVEALGGFADTGLGAAAIAREQVEEVQDDVTAAITEAISEDPSFDGYEGSEAAESDNGGNVTQFAKQVEEAV